MVGRSNGISDQMKRQSSASSRDSQAEFARQLKAGKLAPLYLFEGEENYLREQALKRLIEAAVDATVRDFNVSPVSVSGGNLDQALAIAGQRPMISERRVVIVTGFETITDERQLELLKDYLRQPAETTVLVFMSPALDNRRSIATMLRKTCVVVSFPPLGDRDEAPRWVADYLSRAGSRIDLAEANYLVGMVGTDLGRLANEADKLVSYVGGKGPIERADIDNVVRYSREHSNFDLTDAIVDSDRQRALRLLDHIFRDLPEPPQTLAVMILGAIGSAYRRMLAAKELMSRNASNAEVAKAVGMPPLFVGSFNERVRRFETERILRGISRIAEVDIALKSSLGTPRLQLELLICELCPVTVDTTRRKRG